MNTLKRWLQAASSKELQQLAKLSKTSVSNIRQIAGGYRNSGKVRARPETARAIELATEQIRKSNPKLPIVRRGDLCPACRVCEYYKVCTR